MTEQQELAFAPLNDGAMRDAVRPEASPPEVPQAHDNPGTEPGTQPDEAAPAQVGQPEGADASGAEPRRWHAEAGRKGAARAQQLIQEGKLYEQEHGLKRGRQRLRQLIELGKLYEEEH